MTATSLTTKQREVLTLLRAAGTQGLRIAAPFAGAVGGVNRVLVGILEKLGLVERKMVPGAVGGRHMAIVVLTPLGETVEAAT